MANSMAHDAMVRRLQEDLEERKSGINALIAHAQATNRDLTQSETSSITEMRERIGQINEQLNVLALASGTIHEVQDRMKDIDTAIMRGRRESIEKVEYRSAGAWALDSYKAATGDRAAAEKLDIFWRAAAHQKTSDNLGVIPDPIIGSVINFIDNARPLVNLLGPRPLTSGTFYRPKVTQNTAVAVQGSAGAAADEKTELTSQKMTITRLTGNAVTYGGYVNVSRQNIDFSSPQIMDIIIEDLAAQYAIETEEALGTVLDASTSTNVGYGASPTADSIRGALWSAMGTIYTATKGRGRVVLALSTGRLNVFGPLFVPIVGVSQNGEGLSAADYAAGLVGSIAGIPVYMSPGLGTNKAFLFSTSAVEVYEQRVGTLQVTEPSVLGVQVAYAGYFTAMRLVDNGIIELTAT